MRLAHCIELTGPEVFALTTVIKPFTVPGAMNDFVPFKFCGKLYEAARRAMQDDVESVSIELTPGDCYLINQYVSVDDFNGAAKILLQTWAILREFESHVPNAVEQSLADVELDPSAETEIGLSVFSKGDEDSGETTGEQGSPA